MRGNGGIIGVANNPTDALASGVWTLPEQIKAIATDNWPLTDVADGGTITTYNDGSTLWKVHTFTTSGNFVVATLGQRRK